MNGSKIEQALGACQTRTQVHDTFVAFNIDDNDQRIGILNRIMGDPKTFYTAELSGENKYQREVSIFLTGAWKVNEFHKRAKG